MTAIEAAVTLVTLNDPADVCIDGTDMSFTGTPTDANGVYTALTGLTDNGDGTVTDMVTGLMWQNTLDHNGDGLINYSDKLTYDEILAMVKRWHGGSGAEARTSV